LDSDEFQRELADFAAVCRIVRGFRNLTVAAIGARSSAFKTMRFDELTAQQYGITVETTDLSDFFLRMKGIDISSEAFRDRLEYYNAYADFSSVPAGALEKMIRASLAADQIARELDTDCMTIRCWDEFQREMNISVCNLVSELNDRGVITACELDIANAISMKALACASEGAATCLDFNNNYGNDPDKCILFHCGPVPASMMAAPGTIVEHKMFQKTMGRDVSWGVNQGRIREMPVTYSSLKTEDGAMIAYVDDAAFTNDPIEREYFGTGGVAQIDRLQEKLYAIAKNGYRHHVAVSGGHYAAAVTEAYTNYLGIEVIRL
jgi:L-fucose isomerase-like protein